MPALSSQSKQADDLLSYLKQKALHTFLAIIYWFNWHFGCDKDNNLFLIWLFSKFALKCHQKVCTQLSRTIIREMFPLTSKLWTIMQLMPQNSFEFEVDIGSKLVKILFLQSSSMWNMYALITKSQSESAVK